MNRKSMTDKTNRRSQNWYAKLYVDHVLQADRGADLDFLVGKDTRLVTPEAH